MSTPTGKNPSSEVPLTSGRGEATPTSLTTDPVPMAMVSGPITTKGLANKLITDEKFEAHLLTLHEQHIKLDNRYRLIWTIFCVAAAIAFLTLLVSSLMQMSGSLISSSAFGRADSSATGYAGLWSIYALEIIRARMILGCLFGAFLSVVGIGVIFEGYRSAGEFQRGISPELIHLRQRQSMYRIIPGVVVVVCATILISFSLFSRLPGGPTTPPPVDDIQKPTRANSSQNTPQNNEAK